jgi:hypothetical protein
VQKVKPDRVAPAPNTLKPAVDEPLPYAIDKTKII